jgi:hypothetical protein
VTGAGKVGESSLAFYGKIRTGNEKVRRDVIISGEGEQGRSSMGEDHIQNIVEDRGSHLN